MYVLIVDDNMSNLFVLKAMLGKMKIKYETASNGEEAVNAVLDKGMNCNFTLILMDINMPVMNGIQASKKIMSSYDSKLIPYIPIVAVSAQGDESIKGEAFEAGMQEFAEKPISKQKLEHIISKYEGIVNQ